MNGGGLVQDERGFQPSPQPSPINGEGVPRQAQDERGVYPHSNPLPSMERGSFDRLRMNGGGWAQDERGFHPHPNPLPAMAGGWEGPVAVCLRVLQAIQ